VKLSLFLTVGVYLFVGFQPQAAALKVSNSGLRISPLRSTPSQQPGVTSTSSFSLSNETSQELTINIDVETFSVINPQYDYSFRQDNETKWFQITDKNVTLKPKEKRVIPYALALPRDADPGGHYFAIVASVGTAERHSDITQINRVASLVYLEVSGRLAKNVKLQDFSVPWLSFSRTIQLSTSLVNSGNTHTPVRVKVEQKALPLGQTSREQPTETLLLPRVLRTHTKSIVLPNVPGIYRVSVEFSPPQGGTVRKSRYVIYTPIWSLLVVPLVALWLTWEWKRFHTIQRTRQKTEKAAGKD
jgi:hypothetical protein